MGIGIKTIGDIFSLGCGTSVIAEVGALTFGSKEVAFKFVDEAENIGIDLLKFQSALPSNVVNENVDKYWYNRMKDRLLSKEDFLEVMEYAAKKDITAFASTHNEYDLIELSDAGMEILKIGSGDNNNYRMIDMALGTNKPVIVSLGMLNREEMHSFVKRYHSFSHNMIIMYCVTVYPTPLEMVDLGMIRHLQNAFPNSFFGYSDHTIGDLVPLIASTMPEVSLIEKHFCLPEHKYGDYDSMDISISCAPIQLSEMLYKIYKLTGTRAFSEETYMHKSWARKAICVRRSIESGSYLKIGDLMSIRPYVEEDGHISIEEMYNIVGRQTIKPIRNKQHITYSHLKTT